jgi:DNA invertase Pin-like site-specific DNA recombinase
MTTTTTVPTPEEHHPSSQVLAAIRPEHRKKFAVIYLRESSLPQVRNNAGSTDAQRALAKLAADWGWPAERILVIEDDLGLSGTSSNQRPGLQRIEGMLNRGAVGIVMVRDASRLSRDRDDRERILGTILRAGALLVSPGESPCSSQETTQGTS